jgi:hypothetical protein
MDLSVVKNVHIYIIYNVHIKTTKNVAYKNDSDTNRKFEWTH